MIDPALPEETPEINARMLRQFAGLWLVFWTALAVWQLGQGRPARAGVLVVIALVLGVVGLLKPEAIRVVFGAVSAITRPIGLVMSRIVLALAYYGLFTPLAMVFRLMGRDPLSRKRRAETGSYWTTRTGSQEPRRYLRQI
jgi:hypothetical protein